MPSIKIPTPLRAYTGGNAQVSVTGGTIRAALDDLTTQFPDLKPHLFNNSELRSFVNIFVGDEDIRFLDGLDTPVEAGDALRIIPSIAGGQNVPRRVDQTGLKVGQLATIVLLLLAFVLNLWPVVLFVAVAQLLGGLDLPYAPYKLFYQHIVKPRGLAKPNLTADNPEPHRFAMLVGAGFNFAAVLAILTGAAGLGWVLVWVVIALANLNYWLGFCLGCFVYYQLNKLGVPGFTRAPLA
jgi:molybdopterin converting factor small subunit